MTAALIAAVLGALVLATSFLSGIFGMVGGMILMAGLLLFMPVSLAMVLHGVAQVTSNGWRTLLWRQRIVWPIVGRYLGGLFVATLVFLLIRFVPDRAVSLIVLGLTPFVAIALPEAYAPRADRPWGAEIAGAVGGTLQLVSGVAGPMLDVFFVRSPMDRRAVVATKAACQTATHLTKLAYFGSLGGFGASEDAWFLSAIAVIAAILGTSLGRVILERLTNVQFRFWTRWLACGAGAACMAQGAYLLWR